MFMFLKFQVDYSLVKLILVSTIITRKLLVIIFDVDVIVNKYKNNLNIAIHFIWMQDVMF